MAYLARRSRRSCITNMSTRKMSRYTERSATDIWFAIRTNRGGIRQVPVYAKAICTPMIACDLSAPK